MSKKVGGNVDVVQDRQMEGLSEVNVPKNLSDETKCTPEMHTSFRSLLGSLNWLQSRTQFYVAHRFSTVASASAGPTVGDMRILSKIVRTVRMDPQNCTSTGSRDSSGLWGIQMPHTRTMQT